MKEEQRIIKQTKSYTIPSSHVVGSRNSAPLLLSVKVYVVETPHNPSID